MNICIDGLSMSTLQGTGLHSYSNALFSYLFEMYSQAQYDIIWDGGPGFQPWTKYKNLTFSSLKINRIRNEYTPLEEHLKNIKADIYHSPNNGFSIPKDKVCKYIITAHDLSPVSCGSIVDQKYSRKFMSQFPHAVEKADCIIAVSEFIKEELLKFYKIPDKKIKVIYPWCPDIFRGLDLVTCRNTLKERYKIQGKFILYAGSIHRRKNLDLIINSFKMVARKIDNLKLVIVGNCEGKRRDYFLTLKELIKSQELEKNVVFTGLVPYQDMPCFYNCAECTLNLSSYDGFPITAVEAAACNSPLICTRSSSFPEVVSESAIFVDYLDANIIKNTVLDIISKGSGKKRINNEFQFNAIQKYSIHAINKLVRIYETAAFGNA